MTRCLALDILADSFFLPDAFFTFATKTPLKNVLNHSVKRGQAFKGSDSNQKAWDCKSDFIGLCITCSAATDYDI
ncbi:MAG: hypothetical protein BWY49_01199 [Candidatus Omnitrophica bacterium ADurb.Bin314]|nr:MAG: hypothetical protein BWY49_01199 [Candidatus Omnitrophica bacterium ADurb.Bin314]